MLAHKSFKHISISVIFEEIGKMVNHLDLSIDKTPKFITFSNGITCRFNSKLRVFHSGKTSCICCGKGKRKSDLYFQYTNDSGLNLYAKYGWKSSMLTIDHNLLKSLGGDTQPNNLNTMCYECNYLRGNNFAEVDEFLYWYNHPKRKSIIQKNFSYIDGRMGERESFQPYKLPFEE